LAARSAAQDAAVQRSQKVFGGEAVAMLRRLMKESGTDSRDTNMSIPIFSSFLTVMELPAMSEAELASAIQFEAKKYIPVPLDSVVIDWSLIGTTPDGKVSVLLIAIPKDLVSEYANISKESDLKLMTVELETISAARALVGNDPVPAVLMDIGSRDTTISVVDGGFVKISHSIETSGEDLTRVLASNLGVNWQRAEEIKKQSGLKIGDSADQITNVLVPLLDVISGAAQNIIDIYFTKTQKKIEKIIIYGGVARMPGFTDYLKSRFKMDVVVGDPFGRVAYPGNLAPIIKDTGNEFTVAVGLALKSLQ
jgi:type IV pilus assembly protein PilM